MVRRLSRSWRFALGSTALGAAALELAAIALSVLGLGISTPAMAAESRPVPAMTIYPGDIIRDDMLIDQDFPDAILNSSFVPNRSLIVGKAARRTLLPGQAIPTNAVGAPRLVTVGAMVRLVYVEGGLNISTYASALQAGAAGDLISVRNPESGVVISGIVQPDGSIQVGGG